MVRSLQLLNSFTACGKLIRPSGRRSGSTAEGRKNNKTRASTLMFGLLIWIGKAFKKMSGIFVRSCQKTNCLWADPLLLLPAC